MRVINALVRKCELFKKKKKKKAIERHKITLVKVTIIIKKGLTMKKVIENMNSNIIKQRKINKYM